MNLVLSLNRVCWLELFYLIIELSGPVRNRVQDRVLYRVYSTLLRGGRSRNHTSQNDILRPTTVPSGLDTGKAMDGIGPALSNMVQHTGSCQLTFFFFFFSLLRSIARASDREITICPPSAGPLRRRTGGLTVCIRRKSLYLYCPA